MDIRKKAVAGIIAILLLFLLILVVVSSSIITANYESLEGAEVQCYSDLVLNNFAAEQVFLATLAHDWSECNDTVAFLSGTNPEHVNKKFSPEKIARFDYNFVIITDTEGTVRFAQGYDTQRREAEAVPGSVIAAVTSPDSPFRGRETPARSGFIVIPEKGGPALVAASPVQNAGRTADPAGVLFIGKYIYTGDLAKYRSDAIPFLAISAAGPGSGLSQNGLTGGSGTSVPARTITALNTTIVRGDTYLPDIFENDIIVITIEIPRTIMVQGQNALISFILFELATGLVMGAFIILLLDRLVLSRLLDISTAIGSIAPAGRVSGRVQVAKDDETLIDDEISRLADAMNQMLAKIDEMQTRILENKAKLVRAENVAGFGYWEFDLETKDVATSAGARAIYGLSDKEYTIPQVQAVVLPACRGYLDKALKDLVENNAPYNVEFSIRRPDNDRIVEIHSIAEYDPARHRVFGVIHDITRRKEAEREIRESEERYRSLMVNIPELVIVHRQGTILFANEALARAVAIPREDLVGRSIYDFIAPESQGPVRENIRKRSPGAEPPKAFEVTFIVRGHERRHGLVNTAGIHFAGKPASLVIIADISSRKAMEETLTTANRKLQMLASITRHDIRNKILGLRAYIAIAMQSAPDDTEKTLLGQMDDIARTIDEQIEFTREYQTMGVHAPQWLSVGETMAQAAGQLDPEDIAIRNETGTLELFSDPLLGKVFYNLFDNAIRHGGTVTEIRVHYRDEGDRLVLLVEDDGAGIPPEDKLDIFERGFGKNTGLGLFMIREILAITGITIRETGVFGKGARFELLVPGGNYRFRESHAAGSPDTP